MTIEELGVEAGQIVARKYRLQTLIGRGGMGSVWRCHHLELQSTVALKVIKPEVARNPNSVARFMREAKASAMLRSPHVVQIFEHGVEGNIIYIAMELLEGDSLLGWLRRFGTIEPRLLAAVMTHVGRAMQKAHDAGVVHRDLKPDNIFLVQNDDEVVAKVLDFGIAKSSVFQLNQTGESPQTQTGALLGTPYYMSPEQATGQKDVDHRADLWAMGVITFECLFGKRPYQSDSLGDLVLQICSRAQPVPSQLGPVPAGFDDWFRKAQERDPAHRFQSAKDLTRELRSVLLGESESAPMLHGSGHDQPRPRYPSSPDASITGPNKLAITPTSPAAPYMFAPKPASGELPPPSGGDGTVSTRRSVGPSFSPHVGPGSAPTSGPHVLAASGMGLETLDPLAATTAPKRRRAVLGVAIGVGALCAVAAAAVVLTRDGGPAPASSASQAAELDATAAAGEPDATTTTTEATETTADDIVDLDESATVDASADPPPRPRPGTRPPVAVPAPPPIARPSAPPPQPKHVPKPKPATDDPLGI